tara:strand:+ start:53122 stop:56367 length:3246 start_codon:yes stop_codon:yes gene_type:complete
MATKLERKKITIVSKELLNTGPDRLKVALGDEFYIAEEAEPAYRLPDSNSAVYNQYYERTKPTSDAYVQEHIYGDFLGEYDNNLPRAMVDSTIMPFGVPPLIGEWEANFYNVDMISQNAYVPNFKVPIRFFASWDNSKGDLYWNKYWMGGVWDGKEYAPLIDENKVLYIIKSDFYMPYSDEMMNHFDAEYYDGIPSLKYSINAFYEHYDRDIQNRIDWEKDIEEKLLPSYLFVRDRYQGNFSETYFDSSDTGITVANESGGSLWRNYTFQEINLAIWHFGRRKMVGDIDDAPARAAANRKNDYFNTNWPKTWDLEDVAAAREHARRHLENIFIDQFYYEYYGESDGDLATGVTSDDHSDKETADERHKNIIASSKPYGINIGFDRHKTNEPADGFEQHNVHAQSEGKANYNTGKNLIRDVIEESKFSTKFLEALKDLDDGQFPNFPQKTKEYSTQLCAANKHGLTDVKSISSDGASWSDVSFLPEEKTIENRKFKCFEFLDLLGYLYNNQEIAINDNFTNLGPASISHQTTVADSTLYRYVDQTKLLLTMDKTMDYLGQYYSPYFEALRQKQYYLHPDPDRVEDPLLISLTDRKTYLEQLAKNFFMIHTNTPLHVLAYRIDKYETTDAGDPVGDPIQKFWIFNSSNAPNRINIKDTQVKFGKQYCYKVFAYTCVLTSKYKYDNLRLTKQIARYDRFGEDERATLRGDRENALGIETYCVQFYNPYSEELADQTFSSTLGEYGGDTDSITYQQTVLSEENLFATLGQEIIRYPQAADIYFNFQPCLEILEIPMIEKTIGVFDNPSYALSPQPFHFMDTTNRLAFSLRGEPFKPYFYPPIINQEDKVLQKKYMQSRSLYNSDFVSEYSRSPARYIEMYRISKTPESFADFANNMVSRIDLRIPDSKYNVKDYVATDRVLANKKYYYVFRTVNEAGMPSWPSPIIESTLVDDGGYIYSIFDTYDTSNFLNDPFKEPSVQIKKMLQLEPNIKQMQFDITGVDFKQPAQTQLDNIQLGTTDGERLWDKKFKIRLTSKKTGKKIDINVTYEINKSVSTEEHIEISYLDPDSDLPYPLWLTSTGYSSS